MRLKDKHILITGSATGIGEAMARRFIAEGARVLVHGIDGESTQRVARALGERADWYATLPCAPELIAMS